MASLGDVVLLHAATGKLFSANGLARRYGVPAENVQKHIDRLLACGSLMHESNRMVRGTGKASVAKPSVDWVPVESAQAALMASRDQVLRWIEKGHLVARKDARGILIYRNSVDAIRDRIRNWEDRHESS